MLRFLYVLLLLLLDGTAAGASLKTCEQACPWGMCHLHVCLAWLATLQT